MANSKVYDLPDADTPQDTDVLYIVQGNGTLDRKITWLTLRTLLGGGVAHSPSLLMEDGSYLLLEDGSTILTE